MALALGNVDAHRSFTAGMCTRCVPVKDPVSRLWTSCGLSADSEGVFDDPHIGVRDSRSPEPLGRVSTWQGRRTTDARPLTHQGPDRETYRRAPLRTGTSSGPGTWGRSWPTVGTAAPSALAGRTRGHLPGPGDSTSRGSL